MKRDRAQPLRDFGLSLLALALASGLAYGVLWAADFAGTGQDPLRLVTAPGAVDTLANLGEVTVAILGIAITVVAIILELAANRYTPRITDLFLRDPVNAVVMGFFVLTSVLTLWTAMSLYGPEHPRAMVLATLGAMTLALLAILPYFAYVFDFLSPSRFIDRIRLSGSRAMDRVASRGERSVTPARAAVLTGVEQLGDIALNAVAQKDKAIGIAALSALEELARASVEAKPRLPAAWFDTEPLVARDQDLVAMHPDMVRALGRQRTWVEMKVLRQYQAALGDALDDLRDVGHLVAILTRRIARHAGEHGDLPALDLALRFMNSYLRATINAGDVRTAYYILNEYRALAEVLVDQGHHDRVEEAAERLRFYGQLAFGRSLPFILETTAYDLCTLIQHAHRRGAPCHDAVLATFLEVDREPEDSTTQEAALRGVRKAQVKLATWYLVRGERALARRIHEDMRHEPAARLRSILEELRSIEQPEYWEVSDRGINFDWLPGDQRARLEEFAGWFEVLDC